MCECGKDGEAQQTCFFLYISFHLLSDVLYEKILIEAILCVFLHGIVKNSYHLAKGNEGLNIQELLYYIQETH